MTPDDMVLTPRGLRFQGQVYPCTIGKTGCTSQKREGDGATPIGTHPIGGMLYRPDRMARPVDWARPIKPGDLWSDDVTQRDYNTMVRAPYAGRHEVLRRADQLYDLVIIVGWNWPHAISGKGSAIFIHQYRRPGYPTEGCIALSRSHLRHIAARIGMQTRLIVSDNMAV
ncbi:L,D-transpeptidase family protein [Roseobacter sp.]|uniref:L,D-transpeptidase family protein n=1 Tax=Roseobacter sp. TaxID=1907202 RepID=UPI003298D1DC